MKFKIAPRLLDHFGIAMYNTVPKAIAELCANSYDADATRVDITYNGEKIAITDNGVGMTQEILENDYLFLGRDRRNSEQGTGDETTERKRPVIGNKGIGKLAGFGVAKSMTVSTWRDGIGTKIVLNRQALETSSDLESFEIHPIVDDTSRSTDSGTEVQLVDLLDGIHLVEDSVLRAYLARHLPGRPDWSIFVNGVECAPEDINGEKFLIDDEVEDFGRVTGYYIVATDRRSLQPGFAVRVRERIVSESSLFGLNQQTHGYFNLVRIVGELNPDFIDPVNGEGSEQSKFVINTSRDGFNPEDPAVQALEEYARKKLESIASGLAKQRSKDRRKAALKRHPEFEDRLKALGPDLYERLDDALEAMISKLSKNESDETVDQVVDLVIRFYESDALRIILESMKSSDPGDVEKLSQLLSEYGAAQIAEVTGILHTQLQIIELLRKKVDEGVLENEVHKIIAKNIWLLRSSLTYWFDNKQFATVLGDKLDAKFKFAAAKRPDLACYDDRPLADAEGKANKLIVIEFKRPGVTIGADELLQVMQYKKVFATALAGFPSSGIEVILLGDKFDPSFDFEAFGEGYSIMSYHQLLVDAHSRYGELYSRLTGDSAEEIDEE